MKTPNLVQKGPDGPRVWADTSLTLLRPSNLEIMHFESEKKRAFIPPPVAKTEVSFKNAIFLKRRMTKVVSAHTVVPFGPFWTMFDVFLR